MLRDFVWSLPFIGKKKTDKQFHFKEVTVNEVFKNLKKLSRKKSPGIDNLSPGFLKDAAIIIAKPLCQVINLTLKSGLVPTDWKIGKVTPVFKSGSKNDIDNYRPITVLPVCSKVFEKCVHHQLMNFYGLSV